MMGPDKKKTAMLIVAGMKPEKPEVEAEVSIDEAKEAAAEDILAAIEKKDAKLLKLALSDMIQLCEVEEDRMEGDSEEEME